jgi:hypothetical protein
VNALIEVAADPRSVARAMLREALAERHAGQDRSS